MKTSPSWIARLSADPERDGSVLENVLITSGMSSDTGIITVDATPLPLHDEGMLEMKTTGERVNEGMIEMRLIASLQLYVTMTGLGMSRLTRLP